MKDIRDVLKDNLISVRKHSGLTQIELGEKINYSDKTISKWENGDSCPNIEALYRIAAFYHISIDDLVDPDFVTGVREDNEKENKIETNSKLVISLLAVIAVWTIATIVFVYSVLYGGKNAWFIYVSAVPATAVVVLIFNSLWGNRKYNFLIISILLWTSLVSVFTLTLVARGYSVWVIFLLGIPIQIAIILWSRLKKRQYEKRQYRWRALGLIRRFPAISQTEDNTSEEKEYNK